MAFGRDINKITNNSVQSALNTLANQIIPVRVLAVDNSPSLTNGEITGDILTNQATVQDQQLISASPLFPNISYIPLINEVVFCVQAPSSEWSSDTAKFKHYYICPVNMWDNINTNPTPNPYSQLKPTSQDKSILEVDAGSSNKSSEEDNNTFKPGTYFREKSNIYPLFPYEGDIIYEGRWGNSIRFGSTAKPTDINALNNWSEVGENGDPITIVRNGQPLESSDEGWVPITENVNDDLSSIYQTSTQKIPIQVASENYNSYVTPPEIPSQYTKPQVIINSDRLVFNAKTDSVLLSAEKSIGLSSNNSLNFNSKNYTVDAGNIKLGSKNATEPLVKGETLYKNLTQIVNALTTLVDVMEVQQLWPGGIPTPDGATSVTARATRDILNNVQKDLVNIKSKVSKTI